MPGQNRHGFRSLGFWFGSVALASSACATASSSHEKSPVDESSHESRSDESSGDDTEKPVPSTKSNVRDSAGDAKSSEGAPVGQSDDVQAVLQLAVDDTELDQYLKLGEAGRFPLKVAGSAVPQNANSTKPRNPLS